MPPRKTKKESSVITETPIVFFLKVIEEEDDHILPAGDAISYADILNTMEVEHAPQTFHTDLLKSVLEKVGGDRYNAQTACFWCCHSFGWTACVLPKQYDAYKDIYTAEGHFCSPECALAYNYADPKCSDGTKWLQHSLLETLYASLYVDKGLSPAPPRTLLRMFGGPLDISQFREYTCGDNHLVQSELPPIRLVFPSMNVHAPLRDVKKYVALSHDVIEKASEQLRLKRSKPVHANMPTLDMCIKKK